MDTYDWGDITARLTKMLRLQTPPVGMKWIRTEEELYAIPKVRIHDKHLPPCTIVSHAAQFNWTSLRAVHQLLTGIYPVCGVSV